MTDEQFERLLSCIERMTASNERLADSMETLQVSNALLLNAITVDDLDIPNGAPKGASQGERDRRSMDDPPE